MLQEVGWVASLLLALKKVKVTGENEFVFYFELKTKLQNLLQFFY